MTDTLHVAIRPARGSDLAIAEEIEAEADALLVDLFGATDWPSPASASERSALPGFVLVAEGIEAPYDVVGFAHVLEIEGQAHLEQLSVLPRHGRRGYGRMLVAAAKAEARRRGYHSITLRTYRDVAWNGPFYATCGFHESLPSTPFLHRLVEVESRLDLDRYGPRIQMTAVV